MEFPATLDYLNDMILYIRKQAEARGVMEKVIYKMELACEEAVVNIISYAYPKKKGTLTIICEIKNSRFEITLCDRGVFFSPLDVDINPQTDRPVHERKVGGLGIFLIRKVIDEASYQRIGKENVLRLSFSLD